jgi:hypothetical protein
LGVEPGEEVEVLIGRYSGVPSSSNFLKAAQKQPQQFEVR